MKEYSNISSNEIIFLLNNWDFKVILNIITLIGNEAFGKKYKNDISHNIQKIIDTLVEDENFELLEPLLEIADILEIEVDQSYKEKVNEKSEKLEKRKKYTSIKINDELIRFYIDELLLHEIDTFERELENQPLEEGKLSREPQEISNFSDKIKLYDLKRGIRKNFSQMFEWIKQCLVLAIKSELDNQVMLKDTNPAHNLEFDVLLESSSSEQIRKYLHCAINRFSQEGWEEDFGGGKWVSIAKLAYEMWRNNVEENEKTMSIDQAIDLEHNTGSVFDKDPENIKFSAEREKRILEKKRYAKDIHELLEALKEESTNQVLIEQLERKVSFFEELKTKPTKAKGSD